MHRAESGFTLIEILTALVVLSIVGISAQLAIAQYMDVQSHLQSRRQAHLVAWNGAMDVYRQSRWPASLGLLESGSEEGKATAFRRHWLLSTERKATLNNRLQRVEVMAADADDAAVEASVVLFVLK